jgi:hypothetical protein
MIHLTKGQTEYMYLTLTEKQTITAPNYLFTFQNRSSNIEVKFVLTNNKDISQFKERYNKFQINVNLYFQSKANGQWIYRVYEQTSSTNITVNGQHELESGLMNLEGEDFEYTEYQTTDTYKIRQ